MIFRANECSESWIKYTDYIDDKVLDGLYKVIYVSLDFLLKNMCAEVGTLRNSQGLLSIKHF